MELSCWVANVSASAPPESVLPGQWHREAEQPSLPDESQLPAATTQDQPPVVHDPTGDDPNPELEEEWVAMDPDWVRQENDRPWLRLQLDGPTSPLRSLRFSSDATRLFAGGGFDDVIYRFDPEDKSFGLIPLPRQKAYLRMVFVDPASGHLATSYANLPGPADGPRMAVLIDPGD